MLFLKKKCVFAFIARIRSWTISFLIWSQTMVLELPSFPNSLCFLSLKHVFYCFIVSDAHEQVLSWHFHWQEVRVSHFHFNSAARLPLPASKTGGPSCGTSATAQLLWLLVVCFLKWKGVRNFWNKYANAKAACATSTNHASSNGSKSKVLLDVSFVYKNTALLTICAQETVEIWASYNDFTRAFRSLVLCIVHF